MDLWLVTVICIAAAVLLHFLAEFTGSPVVAVLNILLHIDAVLMLLLLAAELRMVTVFLTASVAADLIFRSAVLRRRRKAAVRAGENGGTTNGTPDETNDKNGGDGINEL